MTTSPKNAPFGSILTDTMAIAWYREGAWSPMELRRTGTLEIHPAAHALHYGSSCFEGFKAYRHPDGSVQVFRLARHIERMRRSAQALILPEPDPALLANMVNALVDRVRADVESLPRLVTSRSYERISDHHALMSKRDVKLDVVSRAIERIEEALRHSKAIK